MSLDGPKAATGNEIRSAAELSGRIFRTERRLPEPRPDDVRENMRIFADGGRTVSLVAMNHRPVRLAGTEHMACCFGGVCTDPDYRGRGLATALLEDCRRRAVAEGADLVLISGRRGLYRRAGYTPVGHFDKCLVERNRLPAADDRCRYSLRRPASEDLPALMRMHVAESTRFVRTPERLLGLVRQKHIWHGQGETYVACRGDEAAPVAYVTCQIGGRHHERRPANHVRIVEVAGSRWAIVHAMTPLLDMHEAESLEVFVWGHDAELRGVARDCGWPTEPCTFHGTVGIINPERFWEACAPLFAGLIGRDRLGELTVRGAGPVCIAGTDEELLFEDTTEFTRFAFTHPERRDELELGLPADSGLRRTLEELFPIPLVNYGLTYL